MSFAAAVVATNVLVPVLMLVGGLVILVVGLFLLSSRRETGASSRRETGAQPQPTPDHPVVTGPPCDWSATLESTSGERITLRPAQGRSCCHWLFRLSSVNNVAETHAPVEERLFYSGAATRIGRDGAVTPLQRERISRSLSSTPTDIDATLTLERSPGPSIGSPGWEQLDGLDAGDSFDRRAKRALELHLDQLRAQGAQLAVGDVSPSARLSQFEQLSLHVTLTRGCDAEPATLRLQGQCRVGWTAQRRGSFLHRAAGRLTAWIHADSLQAAAATPSTDPSGIESWQAAQGNGGAGVVLVADPSAETSHGAWSGDAEAVLAHPDAVVVMGRGVEVEAVARHGGESHASLQVEAACVLRVRLEPPDLGSSPAPPAAADQPEPSCTCARASMELTLGTRWQDRDDMDLPDSSSGEPMRLDERTVRLGHGARITWHVVEADPRVTELDVSEPKGGVR